MDHDSFWLICTDDKTKCHCDWRITIVDCIERAPMLYIYVINTILSFIALILGAGVLFHRVVNKKLPIFDRQSFLIRPKPIESLIFFGIIFNILRIINTILLITDAAPNAIARSFLYELPWQFGICAFSCYLCGVAHTISSSSKIFEKQWYMSIKIDIVCNIMITLPFITNNICSIAAAVYANRGDMIKAKGFTDALYFLWTIYCFTYAVWIFLSGLKLVSLLKLHLNNQRDEDPNSVIVLKVRRGLFKVQMIMTVSIICLSVFTFIKICYGIARVPILKNSGLNLAIAVIWTYDGTLASLVVFSLIILSPKALSSFGPSSSSEQSASTNFYHSATRSTFFMHNSKYNKEEFELNEGQVEETQKTYYNPHQVRLSDDFMANRNSLSYSSISKHHLVSPAQQ